MTAESLYRDAIAKPIAERSAFLDAACVNQPDLRVAVDALLAAHNAETIASPSQDFGQTGEYQPETAAHSPTAAYTPNVSPDATGAYSPIADERPTKPYYGHGQSESDEGLVIAGRYTLLKAIGEGGMGSVYLASQTEPVKRNVALKLIKAGMDSKGVLARFDAERQALAMMDHPNIARIYDGGLTPDGQPFFVMELVNGQPLTQYCDQQRLNVQQRLQLFVAVCHAVQHAHQKGIIHRDLKPGNVLVTEVDGRPTPKVIDFGVAKATEHKLTDMSFNDAGAIVGTPTYMSPEQADPTSMDIDTRTDVYALGVMLYELLVGSPPLEAKQFKRAAVYEMLRMVREVDPPRPSTKLSAAEALPNIAANRSIEPAKLAKLLQGELDWVVMKALEKDRTRRYDTANAFALDLQRYLADEIVEARPPSRGYRLKKFVKRNKLQVIAASVVFLALVGGVVGTTVGMLEAQTARRAEADRANAEQQQRQRAQKAEVEAKTNELLANTNAAEAKKQTQEAKEQLAIALSMTNFLTEDLLAQASQRRQIQGKFVPQPNLTVRDALDRAAKAVGNKFAGQPRVEATIRHTLGVAFRDVSANAESIEQLKKALELRQNVLGAEHNDTIESKAELGESYFRASQPANAVKIREELLELSKRKYPADDPRIEAAAHTLAGAYDQAGRSAEALKLYERIRDERIARRGINDRNSLITLNNLAELYSKRNRHDQALKIYEQIHQQFLVVFGVEHPDSVMLLSSYGSALCLADQETDRGLKLMEQANATAIKHFGRTKYETILTRNNLAQRYTEINKLKQGIAMFEETLDDANTVLGKNHEGTMMIMFNLSQAYLADERPGDALKMMLEVADRRKALFGLNHRDTVLAYEQVGYLGWVSNRYELAIKAFLPALEGAKLNYGGDHPKTVSLAFNLAFNYRDNKQLDEAGKVLTEWFPIAKASKQPISSDMLEAGLDVLVQSNDRSGKHAENVPLLKELIQGLRTSDGKKDDPEFASRLATAGRMLLQAKMYDEAESVLRDSLAIREKAIPKQWQTHNARSMLGGALLGQKKYAEAEPLIRAGYEELKKIQSQIPKPVQHHLAHAIERMMLVSEALGKKDEAAKYRQEWEASPK